MSRRVCETCAWCVMGVDDHGICSYRKHVTPDGAKHMDMLVIDAAERIVYADATCEHWEREEDASEAR